MPLKILETDRRQLVENTQPRHNAGLPTMVANNFLIDCQPAGGAVLAGQSRRFVGMLSKLGFQKNSF